MEGLQDRLQEENILEEQEIEVQQIKKNKNIPSYDLEKGLSFEIKTLVKHFQFNNEINQNIPIMVSVKTQDLQTTSNDELINACNNRNTGNAQMGQLNAESHSSSYNDNNEQKNIQQSNVASNESNNPQVNDQKNVQSNDSTNPQTIENGDNNKESVKDYIEETKMNENLESVDLEQRASVDLICVIDNSGSMTGEKIKNVKTTLLQLVDMLNENDRLSLITFNSYPTLLCSLRKINSDNKVIIQNIINNINASGGTDINCAMTMAFNVLAKRKQNNPVTSIFLLSDGQDRTAYQKVKKYLDQDQTQLSHNCFSIHSFGFGADHDGELMKNIASLKDGNFYYVEHIDQVDEFFVDALGGLFSVVAQDICIKIKLNKVNKNLNNYRVSKTYGEMWKCTKQDEEYEIQINQLFSGVSKDFIFQITVPKGEVETLQDFERNIDLVSGQLTAIPVDIQYSTKIVKESNLVLTLFLQKETIALDSEIDDNVEFNFLRVQAAEAMDLAINFAEKQQYDMGQKVLNVMLSNLEKSHPKNYEKVGILKKDILDCQESAKPKVYEHHGKHKMLCKKEANYKQCSQAVESHDNYQNKVQKMMVCNQKSKK